MGVASANGVKCFNVVQQVGGVLGEDDDAGGGDFAGDWLAYDLAERRVKLAERASELAGERRCALGVAVYV